MANTPRLLEAYIEPKTDASTLRRENSQLRSELERTRQSLRESKQESESLAHGMKALRKTLGPLHNALRVIFGELDAAGVPDSDVSQPQVNSRTSAAWESWKQKLGGGPAKVIDALLLHGEKNTQQLSILTGFHRTTIPALIYKLNQAGLINKSNGKFSLKEI